MCEYFKSLNIRPNIDNACYTVACGDVWGVDLSSCCIFDSCQFMCVLHMNCWFVSETLSDALLTPERLSDESLYDKDVTESKTSTTSQTGGGTAPASADDVTSIDWLERGQLLKRKKQLQAFVRRTEYRIRQVRSYRLSLEAPNTEHARASPGCRAVIVNAFRF